MAKYTGVHLMDDTGIKEQAILGARIQAKLQNLLGDGQFATNVSQDNARALKWSYITNSDETPATEAVLINPNAIDDPATAEIADHAKKTAKDAKADKDAEGAELGSQADADKLLTGQN